MSWRTAIGLKGFFVDRAVRTAYAPHTNYPHPGDLLSWVRQHRAGGRRPGLRRRSSSAVRATSA